MSQLFSEEIKAHESIYAVDPIDRTIHIEYGVPDNGVNEATGMLVVLPGYSGKASANVHRHMREVFPDKYNMIILHCDYFGLMHMQSDVDEGLLELLCNPHIFSADIAYMIPSSETENDFNDMGLMQALDMIYAVKYIVDKYSGEMNTGKIILFGTSHGAYIGHLANVICPDLFAYLIDISSYIIPYYLDQLRSIDVPMKNPNIIGHQLYRYIAAAKRFCYDERLFDLNFLYRHVKNRCKIISFQGIDDWMVNPEEKTRLISGIENAEIVMIEENDVDGEIIRGTGHGLKLDFIKFLDMYLEIFSRATMSSKRMNLFNPTSIKGLIEMSLEGGEIRVIYVKGAKEFGQRIMAGKSPEE